jgi:hypothetical protein
MTRPVTWFTGKWADQSHLTLESEKAGTEFTVYAVLWPERSPSAPSGLKAALNDGALRISRPDGKIDLITLTDTSLELK